MIQPTDREISSANRLPPRCRGEQTDESLAHNGDIMNTAAMVTYATTKSIRPEQNSNAVLKWTTYETSLGIVTFVSMPRVAVQGHEPRVDAQRVSLRSSIDSN